MTSMVSSKNKEKKAKRKNSVKKKEIKQKKKKRYKETENSVAGSRTRFIYTNINNGLTLTMVNTANENIKKDVVGNQCR